MSSCADSGRSSGNGSTFLDFQFLRWSAGDVAEFQAIWLSLVGKTDAELKEMAITLLLWMFEHVPNMKVHFQKFSKLSNDEIVGDQRFLMHAQGVIVMLNKLINGLADCSDFDQMVSKLCIRHLKLTPPVGVEYFKDFRDNIHLFVYEMTGANKASRPSILFYQFLDNFVDVVKDEAKAMKKEDGEEEDTKKKKVKKGGCCIIM